MDAISPIRIGVDFDNTIVSYDTVFQRVALEQKLVPADIPASKSEVRNYLRRIGREDAWTAMQGLVYGKRMIEAEPFPGVIDFFRNCRAANLPVFIISHRTRFPIVGEQYDLHAAAGDWLRKYGIFDFVPRECVYFELTRHAKLERIKAAVCTHFIDDLPELFSEPGFPQDVRRILFDPLHAFTAADGIFPEATWLEIQNLFAL
jgi:hypothetical protein